MSEASLEASTGWKEWRGSISRGASGCGGLLRACRLRRGDCAPGIE